MDATQLRSEIENLPAAQRDALTKITWPTLEAAS